MEDTTPSELILSSSSSHGDSGCSNHCNHHNAQLSSCEHCLDNASLHSIRSSSYDEGVSLDKSETDPDLSQDSRSQTDPDSSLDSRTQNISALNNCQQSTLNSCQQSTSLTTEPPSDWMKDYGSFSKRHKEVTDVNSEGDDIIKIIPNEEQISISDTNLVNANTQCTLEGEKEVTVVGIKHNKSTEFLEQCEVDQSSQENIKKTDQNLNNNPDIVVTTADHVNVEGKGQQPLQKYKIKEENKNEIICEGPGISEGCHNLTPHVLITPGNSALLTLSLPVPARIVCAGDRVTVLRQQHQETGGQPFYEVNGTADDGSGLRRVYSEPDMGQHRHLHYNTQTWYRRSAYSQCGSVAASMNQFPARSPGAPPTSLWSSTKQEKALLVCILMANLCAMMCLSVMAPFFPSEAETKGVNLTLSSWIFGVFALTEFIFAPIWGKLVSIIDPKFMFLAGMFFSGGCYILFGFVQHIPSTPDDHTVYLVLCFLLRIFTAIGCSAAATSTYTITALTFPNNIATVFGLIETSTGVGMSLGPTIGGILYDVGGFTLPFAFLGGLMIAMVPFSKCMLPKKFHHEVKEAKHKTSGTQLLRVPAIEITCLCVLVAAVVLSVPEPTLEPHLLMVDEYHLSSTLIGLVFLLMSGSYGILAPFYGLICDRLDNTTPLMALGFLGSGLALMLLGPSPHFGFHEGYNKLWLNLVALTLLGAALSLATVPTFDKILRAADKAGFEDNVQMYGVVAGLWGSCNAFGDFIGLSMSGFLTEQYTFPWSMTYIAYACWVMAMFCIGLWVYERKRGHTQMIQCGCHRAHIQDKMSSDQTYTQTDDGLETVRYNPHMTHSNDDDEKQPLLNSSTSVHEVS